MGLDAHYFRNPFFFLSSSDSYRLYIHPRRKRSKAFKWGINRYWVLFCSVSYFCVSWLGIELVNRRMRKDVDLLACAFFCSFGIEEFSSPFTFSIQVYWMRPKYCVVNSNIEFMMCVSILRNKQRNKNTSHGKIILIYFQWSLIFNFFNLFFSLSFLPPHYVYKFLHTVSWLYYDYKYRHLCYEWHHPLLQVKRDQYKNP